MSLTLDIFSGPGSSWMWAIFATQICTLVLCAERVYVLFSKSITQKDLSKPIADDIRNGNIAKALTAARDLKGKNPIGSVIEAGIVSAYEGGGKKEIQEKMDEILVSEQSACEKRIGYLALFANMATLMGLIGTIQGLIISFGGISNLDPAKKQEILSAGISTAMNTTAYGLLVAVPALIMYAVLQNRSSRLTDDLNKAALSIFIALGHAYNPHTQNNEPTTRRHRRV